MKKFFLSMLALASMAGVAVAQEVVATVDYSKLREYPYGEQSFTTEILGGVLVLTDGHDWPQCTIISDVPMEANTTYTLTVAIKGSKKGAANIVFGNWGHEFYSSSSPLQMTDKWEKSSTVINVGDDPAETGMVRMQPNSYPDVMEIAWVVVSKGDAEPDSTPLMPVDLDSAEVDAEVDFSTLDAYTYDGPAAELVDGVLVNSGDEIFNVMEGLTLEEGLDYGIVARVKASEDVEVSVSMGDWGYMVDGSFLAYDLWNEVIVRLGNAPVDDDGKIIDPAFVMFAPTEGYEGTIEVEWVKLVNFVEPEPEPEPVYETQWSYVLDDLTGADGESEHIYCRYPVSVGDWPDEIAHVCEGPDGVGMVFYSDVAAHPFVEEGEEDPIPDHYNQFFIQYPENKFKVGDIMRVKFDYYSTVERTFDTQSHMTAGDYIMYHFVGSFAAGPEWKTFETEVEITDELTRDGEQGCLTINLCTTKDANGNKVDMPAGIFYINHITIEKGEKVLVEGKEPVWQSIITNGDANNGASVNCLARIDGEDIEAPVVANPDGAGDVFSAPIVANPDPGVNDAAAAADKGIEWSGVTDWASQFFIEFNKALEEGTEIKVSFDYYCSDTRTIQTQAHGTPGNYHHWEFVGNLDAKPEWQPLSWQGTISAAQAGADGCKAIAFNLSTAEPAATFYINNIVVEALLPGGDTAVEQIKVTPVVEKAQKGVYNLFGVKVLEDASQISTLRKGIYIVNGKKVAL